MLNAWTRGLCVVLCLVGLVAAGSAWAGPPAEEFGDLAEPLNKEISVNFIGSPLSQAVDTVRRELDVNFLIRDSVNDSRRITLNIENMSAAQVLNLIGLASDTDWYIEQGVIVIATQETVRQRSIKTEIYNINDLVQSVPNYLGPTLSLNDALSNTNSGGSAGRQSESYGKGGGGGGGGLFGDDSDLSESTPSRSEKVSQIMQLIQDTCGNPDEWLDEESTMTELNGSLVVRTTPEVHEQIQSLLTTLSDTYGRMVGVEGQFFAVPRSVMDDLDGNFVLNTEQLAEFGKAVQDAESRRISAGRTVCTDGQRVYIYAGHDTTFLSDLEPIPNAAGVDPTLSNARNGVVIDVLPTITLDGKSLSLAVRTDNIDAASLRTTAVPVGSSKTEQKTIQSSGKIDATQQRKGDNPGGEIEGNVNQSGVVRGETETENLGKVDLEMPENDMLTHRTNVRIPNGGAVILSGVSNMYTNAKAEEVELVLILRARIIE